jgi:hypothetical protein
MIARRLVLAASVVLRLAGCVAPTPPQTAAQDGAPVGEAQLPRFIGVIGAKEQHAPPFLGVGDTNYYRLRSFVDRRTGEILHQVYVSDSYSGAERHWNAAHDGIGRPLRFFSISENEITCAAGAAGCSYVEEFAATLPESELRAGPRGLVVIFTSASGAEKRITISGPQITAQLAAVEAKRSPSQPASAIGAPQSPVSNR